MNRGPTPPLPVVDGDRHPPRCRRSLGGGPELAVAAAVVLVAIGWSSPAAAQMGGMGMGMMGGVGGISIDAGGIVRNLDPKAVEGLARDRRQTVAAGAKGFGKRAAVRNVSLARVVEAVRQAAADRPLPADILYLGGLERITHVFVDTEGHDVILSGPADVATVDAAGTVVAATSRRPLMHLEDLVVALRAIDAAREGGMRCSIDPTPEGIARLQALLRAQKRIGPDPAATFAAMQDAMGPQRVSVGGVPGDSRFAHVLVAADYRLKRIGMGLDPSGVPEVPSYLSLVPPGGTSASVQPRFWLEADYDPLSRDPDELAWRINGRRMRCRTENDLFAADGSRSGKAAANANAEKWCERMTAQYDRLAAVHPSFAELVNCVDLAVVAALIHGRQLAGRAGLDLGPLLDQRTLPLPSYPVPESVPTVANGLKKGNQWVLSASGGVLFQPWSFAGNAVESPDVATSRAKSLAARSGTGCWWD